MLKSVQRICNVKMYYVKPTGVQGPGITPKECCSAFHPTAGVRSAALGCDWFHDHQQDCYGGGSQYHHGCCGLESTCPGDTAFRADCTFKGRFVHVHCHTVIFMLPNISTIMGHDNLLPSFREVICEREGKKITNGSGARSWVIRSAATVRWARHQRYRRNTLIGYSYDSSVSTPGGCEDAK